MTSGRISAGLLLCRRAGDTWQFLLAHPGGPFFARKDAGVWTLPKGLVDPGEDLLAAAKREFHEETGFSVEAPVYWPLGHVVQKGGKRVHAWAFEGDCQPERLRSNTFELQWPPRSGRTREFPEIDRVAFFSAAEARTKLLEAQRPFIDRALPQLDSGAGGRAAKPGPRSE